MDESDALHARVRAYARAPRHSSAEFEQLALDIAHFQARHNAGFARLVERHGSALRTVGEIPAVPVEAFRLTRVAVHPPELDEVRFETSGTTHEARGMHVMRTTQTYRRVALQFGRPALLGEHARATVVALAPVPGDPCSSSLGFMMLAMMEDFDARALTRAAEEPFQARAAERWLFDDQGVNVQALQHAAEVARERAEPLLLLATSFALVASLDALAGARIELPPHSAIMQTGGFKGRSREIEASQLRAAVATAFGVHEDQIVNEYGMTELTSQLYARGPAPFTAPSWLRVDAVNPDDLQPLPEGELGLARFIDLGNVDSAVSVVTQDLIRVRDGSVELRGRAPGAPARGCSLAVEDLLLSSAGNRD
ncbi:MAG TPA: acyl-protein synthetase [Polyangiaceae bacterium]|nr:acyl-protein synthetase [Polyangiaceae bacterium]